jgi:phytoene synthase
MATRTELEAYAGKTSAALIELAAAILLGSRENRSDERDKESAVGEKNGDHEDKGREQGVSPLAHHAGTAYALAGLLNAFPRHAARGQLYVPLDLLTRHGASRQDIAGGKTTPELRAALAEVRMRARTHLAAAAELFATAPFAAMPALLPVALVRPMLNLMERRAYDPFVPVELAQWQRQWHLWRAARRPERIFSTN